MGTTWSGRGEREPAAECIFCRCRLFASGCGENTLQQYISGSKPGQHVPAITWPAQPFGFQFSSESSAVSSHALFAACFLCGWQRQGRELCSEGEGRDTCWEPLP